MSGQKIETVMTTDNRETLKALDKLNSGLDLTIEKLNKVEQASERGARAASSGFGEAVRTVTQFSQSIIGLGTTLGGVKQLIEILKQERRNMEQREERARVAALGPAEAIRRARLNFTPDATMRDSEIEMFAQGMAMRRRTDVAMVANAMGDAFSARGEISNKVAMEAVEQSFRLLPGDQEAGSVFSGRILDVAKLQKAQGGETDPRAILGFLQNVANESRVKSIKGVGEYGVPAILSLQRRGDTAEQAAELFNLMTNLMVDEEGRLAGTAVTNFGTDLAKFNPGQVKPFEDSRGKFTVPKNQATEYLAAKGPTAQYGVLQKYPELRRAFLSDATFEARAQGPMEALLTSEPAAMAALQRTREGQLPLTMKQATLFEDKIASLEGGVLQQQLTAEQTLKANMESFRLGSSAEARKAFARKAVRDMFEDTDLGILNGPIARQALDDAFMVLTEQRGRDPEKAAATIFRNVADDPNQRYFGAQGPSEATERTLNRLADVMEELNRNYQAQAEARKPVRDAPRAPAAAGLGRSQ